MAFNYNKLLGRIVEKFGTQGRFAAAMGMSERSLTLKLHNVREFKQSEIDKACRLLEIPIEESPAYFFAA
jgi:hypothetical protein